MSKTKAAADAQDAARRAGTNYQNAVRLSFDDSRNGLRYALSRLSLMGIGHQDRLELLELARLASSETDVGEAVNRIKNRADAGPLAVAIAELVRAARGSRKAALLGAVFGAYGAFGGPGGRDVDEGIRGAIAGAVAVSTANFVEEERDRRAWSKFAEPNEADRQMAERERDKQGAKPAAKKASKKAGKRAPRR